MKRNPSTYIGTACLIAAMMFGGVFSQAQNNVQREKLGRGLVAVRNTDETVVVSWRLLEEDTPEAAFDVYRSRAKGKAKRINTSPITSSTFFIDTIADKSADYTYSVRYSGQTQNLGTYTLTTKLAQTPYIDIPLQPIDGDADWKYTANDASVGDLDGDGEYEIVIKREGRAHDNAHRGITDPVYIEAYKLTGQMLWRVNLGVNIRAGAHYTQLMVYDFDGDGRAEIAVKTAEGTQFGDGQTIGDTNNDGRTDYLDRDEKSRTYGSIVEGPEFLSVIDGTTGRELARTDYIPRGEPGSFGDNIANRGERYLAAVGYFDGERPSLLICRGYYERTVLEAWDYRNGQLTRRWHFDTHDNNHQFAAYEGQGNHNLRIADVDADGCDEVTYGSCLIDHDGTPAYNTRLGHGDAIHLTDIDIDRPGLEAWDCHEAMPNRAGSEMRDARTGELLWGIPAIEDVGRALAADIDPRFRGCEAWSSNSHGVYTADGRFVSEKSPSVNFAIWWDGDLNRELFDAPATPRNNTVRLTKWNGDGTNTIKVDGFETVIGNNWTKGNPCLQADILGDWREEIVLRSRDNKHIRIFTTTIPTGYRFYTLMADHVYRMDVALQNVAYNQPPHTGFYLGSDLGKFAKTRFVPTRRNNNGKSGRAENGRPNGMNERLRHTIETTIDTLHCTADSIEIDAGCDYDTIEWIAEGKTVGSERKITLHKTKNNEGRKTELQIRAVRHGAVFQGKIYVQF